MLIVRSLRFTCMGLRRNMAHPEEEVSTSMTWAYGEALKPYHGWAVRPLFQASPCSTPQTCFCIQRILLCLYDKLTGPLSTLSFQISTIEKHMKLLGADHFSWP